MTEQTKLNIKVLLEDSFTPLHNVHIQLTPCSIKDSKQPEDKTQEGISQNGALQFDLPKNSNQFELTILDERFLKYAKGDNGIRTTNSYTKGNNYITLHLISKIAFYFNGHTLQIHQNNKITESFIAFSGKALNLQEKQELEKTRGYTNFVEYNTNNQANDVNYFCLDKAYQHQKGIGAIPEGTYYIDITQSTDDKQSGIRTYDNAWYSTSRSKEGEKQWGKYNIPIYTNKECTNTIEFSANRDNFYIHGGDKYGNAGGIDLAKEDTRFFTYIQKISNQILIIKNKGYKDNKNTIELLVEYTHSLSNADLQSIHLQREIQRANDTTIERHRVALTANYTKPESMSEKSFNAQKQQTYWAYKEIAQTEECNTDIILISELQFFMRNNQKCRGEHIEINLIEYQWHNYEKQIIVFAFSPKDIIKNKRGEEVLENPKHIVITRGFRYDMLKRVFNGINYALLNTTPTTQAQRNQYNEVSAKVQKLKDMVDELNRPHTDNEPMFMHYKLDTRARIEHFFAQSWAETWSGQLRLAESISKENANRNYNNRYGNRPNTDDGYNFRGRGLLHLTCRDNYRNCTRYLHNQGWLDNDIDFEVQPQLVTDSGVYALLSAVWVWNTYRSNEQNLYNIATNRDIIHQQYSFAKNKNGTGGTITLNNISENLRLITQKINGWYNNLAERQQAYTRIHNANIFQDFE